MTTSLTQTLSPRRGLSHSSSFLKIPTMGFIGCVYALFEFPKRSAVKAALLAIPLYPFCHNSDDD
jgi:hypothetical protein